ncbi:MAG: hypothetical protein V4604_05365 [Bacteroidota bacterium]
MNKLLLMLGLATTMFATAQSPLMNANCDVTLTVQGEDGTNGVSVTYNPSTALYYTVFAGNALYPIEVHSSNGTSIASESVGFDVRGMWYNPSTKALEGISYDNQGGFEIKLNADGTIKGSVATSFSYGMDGQTVATLAVKKKSIMFVEGNTVSFFKPGKNKAKTITLSPTDMNTTLNTNGPMYTGVKNYEIALFEAETMTVHLFSASSGKETGKVVLKSGSCEEIEDAPSYFRVSYCNDRVFLFDTDARTWTGYKLFD